MKDASHRKETLRLLCLCLLWVGALSISAYWSYLWTTAPVWQLYRADISPVSQPLVEEEPPTCYGFNMEDHLIFEAQVQQGETFADLLLPYGVSLARIAELALQSKESHVLDARRLKSGYPYMVMAHKEDTSAMRMVVQPNPFQYCVFELGDTLCAYKVDLPVTTQQRIVSGVIVNNLWEAITGNGVDYGIAAQMERILGGTVNFHHLQQGDGFKLIYDEKWVNGESVGTGDIHALYFKQGKQEINAFFYQSEDGALKGYYDAEGRPLKRTFLQTPVLYSRISSRYNLRRFHPVLRRVKAHLGTDYAAPYGTPIMATAAGTITKASRTRGNGNFVKIKHDETYETQYLHMQKFAKGIRPGVRVAQGQVIGYVGATGLATGPHVCYRFWKNGKQVDPLREQLPPPDPMSEEALPDFHRVRDSLSRQLHSVVLQTIP